MDKPVEPVRLLGLGLIDPIETQSYYHAIAETMTVDTPDTIIFCRPSDPYYCLGYHQVFDEFLDVEACERRGFPVFRRRVGGGTTYLDKNQLFYQCIFHHTRVPVYFDRIYARLLAAPVAVLQRLGLRAGLRAVNEVEVDGKRIAGIGGGRIGEACVVVGNLLFDFDFEAMAGVWRVPWESFRALGLQAMRSRMATLQQLGVDLPFARVQEMLHESFSETLGRPLEPGGLSQAELKRAGEVAERLASRSYLDLHSRGGQAAPMKVIKIAADSYIRAAEADWKGCKIQASFHIHQGMIQEARIQSMPENGWDELEEKLRGVRYEDWEQLLGRAAGWPAGVNHG